MLRYYDIVNGKHSLYKGALCVWFGVEFRAYPSFDAGIKSVLKDYFPVYTRLAKFEI